MARRPGLSVRVKLTLTYAGVVELAGALLLAAVWVYLRRGGLGPPGRPGDAAASLGRIVMEHYVPTAAVVLAALLAFGLLGGWILAGRMLAPLSRITAATRRAAAGSLSHRIELEGPHDEFRELADAFDGMLARLEAQVAEQQRFAANASHELRTPLAVTQTLLDVARQDPDREDDELLERLHTVNSRAIDLTEALLLLSRADRQSFTREDVDLSLIAEEAVETLLPLAEKHGVEIETSGDVARAAGSRALLSQMTMNLLHNAIVHNLPEHGAVWVATTAGRGSAVLTVENTGLQLDPQSVATLAEPFQRGAARVRTGHAGAGLGLAIVKSIAQAHGATLSLDSRAGGGLRVTVRFRDVPQWRRPDK
jgi:two-component system sensor histidine kinase VanS